MTVMEITCYQALCMHWDEKTEQHASLCSKLAPAYDDYAVAGEHFFCLFFGYYMQNIERLLEENVENLCQDGIWVKKKVSFMCGTCILAKMKTSISCIIAPADSIFVRQYVNILAT